MKGAAVGATGLRDSALLMRDAEIPPLAFRIIQSLTEGGESAVRQAATARLATPGRVLDPMFTLEFAGPGTRTARFVTPDEDVTLPFPCHVLIHEKMGMHGELVVGSGGGARTGAPPSGQHRHDGIGTVISVDQRKARVALDHKEIPGFMAAMTGMSFLVNPPSLLERLHPGDAMRFTIDADQRLSVDLAPAPPFPRRRPSDDAYER